MNDITHVCPHTGNPTRMQLIDDGTLDTVVKCAECGKVFRFSNLYDSIGDWIDRIEDAKRGAMEQHGELD